VQEFHVALTTPEMTRLIHSCDLLLEPEIGLRTAEAMAAGVPVVSIDGDDPIALGERLIEILSDEELRDQMRERGRKEAEQWRAERVVGRLEAFLKLAL
jgi:glycosyltransferase involved in cell wall biosynthesis